jgi:hypothetical protein
LWDTKQHGSWRRLGRSALKVLGKELICIFELCISQFQKRAQEMPEKLLVGRSLHNAKKTGTNAAVAAEREQD